MQYRLPSSNNTHQRSVPFETRLPLELYHSIVRHAATSTNLLCSLSLVCRMFRNEAQRLLYRNIRLDGDYYKLFSWCTTICGNQNLADLVHELTLPSRWFATHPPPLWGQSRLASGFSDALSALTALQILQIHSIRGFTYFSAFTLLGRPFRLHAIHYSLVDLEVSLCFFEHPIRNLSVSALCMVVNTL
jgi:hypothetical protein